MIAPWTKLTLDTALLAMEVQTVIGMRLSQIAMGRGTAAEAQLMMTEKMLALVEAAGWWQRVAQPTRSSWAIASASEPT
ncbi:MAG TPA: hypothetical protein VE420_09755 [Gemmatimonadales bacterium]|nr:hypothetical protein [Gemmatimonadales bacterium]